MLLKTFFRFSRTLTQSSHNHSPTPVICSRVFNPIFSFGGLSSPMSSTALCESYRREWTETLMKATPRQLCGEVPVNMTFSFWRRNPSIRWNIHFGRSSHLTGETAKHGLYTSHPLWLLMSFIS